MRIPTASIWICAYLALCPCSAEVNPAALARRQNNEATSTPTTSRTEQAPSTTSRESPRTQGTPESRSSSALSTTLVESTTQTANAVLPKSTSTGSAPKNTNATPSNTSAVNGPRQTSSIATSGSDKKQSDALPLTPKITPALAIAGVCLILTGITYTLIGIKNRWVQIFLSSAFLTSLSVTVLLIYVQNPPVRPAVEGAYFVAVFMTGAIFGAGALIFKEVTEGLGCLLGGFCLSMWILVLRPGGTLQATGGKVILIAAFTATAYALSFSHYTRPYGLIGATSFAGATVLVLGFDCFSKAGLKEFWIYIWNLNDNLFPLNTNTYPITRGIKVELAVIPLICILGIISQVRLWKIIKDRREKKDAVRTGDERERDQMEEALGRRLEEGIGRERAQWETVYGDSDENKGNHVDSGLGTEENNSLRKVSVSAGEIEGANSPAENLQVRETGLMANEQATTSSGKATTTTRPLEEHAAGAPPIASQQPSSDPQPDLDCAKRTGDTLPHIPAVWVTLTEKAPETSQQTFPPVIPLPFTIPRAEEPERYTERSIHTSTESGLGRRLDSNEPSGREHAERLSGSKEDVRYDSSLDKANVNPYAIHSKGSSLAATIDDDLDELELICHGEKAPILPEIENLLDARTVSGAAVLPDFEWAKPEDGDNGNQAIKGLPSDPPLLTADDSDPEEFHRPALKGFVPEPTAPVSSGKNQSDGVEPAIRPSRLRPTAQDSRTDGSEAQGWTPGPNGRSSLDAVSSTGSLTKGALDQVPSQLSHVVMSYRTNEWAKHISTANEPEFDEPEVVSEGADEELPTHLVERPMPGEVEGLKQTAIPCTSALSASQQAASKTRSGPSTQPNRTISDKSDTSNSNPPSGRVSCDSTTRPDIFQALSAQLRQGTSVADLSSGANATPQPPPLTTRGLRSTSTPAPGQTRTTSPIDENAEAEFEPPSGPSISPLPVANSTLLAKRDNVLRNKHHQLKMWNTVSPTEPIYSQLPFRPNSRLSLIEEAGSRSAIGLSNFDERKVALPLRSAKRLSLPTVNDEDMPLSQRKAIIRQQAAALQAESGLAATDNFDPHLPLRSSSPIRAQKHESMLASWKGSMDQQLALNTVSKGGLENRRAEMLMEKKHSRMSQQHSEMNKLCHENAFDLAMRRGNMQELHEQAMRKMQANANRHVS